jgi:hypothetical protein
MFGPTQRRSLTCALLSRGSGANLYRMKKQQALDVGYDKRTGDLQLNELNQLLANGWTVAQIAGGSGGDFLVILEKDDSNPGGS